MRQRWNRFDRVHKGELWNEPTSQELEYKCRPQDEGAPFSLLSDLDCRLFAAASLPLCYSQQLPRFCDFPPPIFNLLQQPSILEWLCFCLSANGACCDCLVHSLSSLKNHSLIFRPWSEGASLFTNQAAFLLQPQIRQYRIVREADHKSVLSH